LTPPEPWDIPNGQSSDAFYDISFSAKSWFQGNPDVTTSGSYTGVRGPISSGSAIEGDDVVLFFNTGDGRLTAVRSVNALVNDVHWVFSSVSVVPQPGYEAEDDDAPRAPYTPHPLLVNGRESPELNPDGFLEFEEDVDFDVPGGGTNTRRQKFELGRPKVFPGGFKIPGRTRVTHPDGRSGEIEVGIKFDLTPSRSVPASGADRQPPGTIPAPTWNINLPSPAPFEIAPGTTVEVNLLPPGLRVDLERIPLPIVPRPLQPGLELEFGYEDDWGSPRPISPDPCPDPCPPPSGGGGDCPDPCPDPCPEQKELKNEERLIGVQVIAAFGDLPRNVIEIYEDGENLFVPRLGWVTFIYTDDMGFDWRSPPIDIKRLNSFIPAPNSSDVLWSSYEVHAISGVNLFGSYPVREFRQKNIFEYQES
jgi:hypothetical protein